MVWKGLILEEHFVQEDLVVLKGLILDILT